MTGTGTGTSAELSSSVALHPDSDRQGDASPRRACRPARYPGPENDGTPPWPARVLSTGGSSVRMSSASSSGCRWSAGPASGVLSANGHRPPPASPRASMRRWRSSLRLPQPAQAVRQRPHDRRSWPAQTGPARDSSAAARAARRAHRWPSPAGAAPQRLRSCASAACMLLMRGARPAIRAAKRSSSAGVSRRAASARGMGMPALFPAGIDLREIALLLPEPVLIVAIQIPAQHALQQAVAFARHRRQLRCASAELAPSASSRCQRSSSSVVARPAISRDCATCSRWLPAHHAAPASRRCRPDRVRRQRAAHAAP